MVDKHSPFSVLLDLLPLSAEEGNAGETVPVDEIVSALAGKTMCPNGEASRFVETVELIFRSLGVLDEAALKSGHWCFLSFPASLLARSLIATLSVPGQRLFPSGYWEQGAHRPESVIEEQRELLRQLETRRVRFHPDGNPMPIRVVHVAWGFIRLDDHFLLCHREDRHRPEVGNFVLPGGRSNAMDWTGSCQNKLIEAGIPGKRLPMKVLERTLLRELEEELGLTCPADFSFELWRELAPWRQVEGARNHQAYTEYMITGFLVRLTRKGELRLYVRNAHTAWLTIPELQDQRTPDGRSAYVDALIADLGGDFVPTLESIPAATADDRLRSESDAVDIPSVHGSPILMGKTGKEKPFLLDALTEDEHRLLYGLAWHAKGLGFEHPAAALLPRGWVALPGEVHAMTVNLARDCAKAGIAIVEVDGTGYARLLIAPEALFFNAALYRFSFWSDDDNPNGVDWKFCIEADSRETPLGRTRLLHQVLPITRNVARILECVLRGDDPEADPRIKSGDIQKTLRDQIDRPVREFGLRKLVRSENGNYRIEVPHVLR